MYNLIKQLLKENLIIEAIKQGSPEEIVEWLKYLPVDETAKDITNQIITDLNNFYQNDVVPNDKEYSYQPENECLPPYTVEINYRPSNNMTGIGYAEEQYIEIKYLNKSSTEFSYTRGTGNVNRLKSPLFNILKHECSHFYLRQNNVENCLYNTHPDGMKKYYNDRQEQVLHSREMFDTFEELYPNWRKFPKEKIVDYFTRTIKNLPYHTQIRAPFGGGLQKKYLNFILKNFIEPNMVEKELTKEEEFDKVFSLLSSAANTKDIFDEYYKDEEGTFAFITNVIDGFQYLVDTKFDRNNGYRLDIFKPNHDGYSIKKFDTFSELYDYLSNFVETMK